jgi:5-methylcytosine-specific restriction endonuclease McrA
VTRQQRHQQKIRDDPVLWKKELARRRARDQKIREDPVLLEEKRARDRARQRRIREDPVLREKARTRDRARYPARRQKIHEDPVLLEKELARHRRRHQKVREDPALIEKERARNRARDRVRSQDERRKAQIRAAKERFEVRQRDDRRARTFLLASLGLLPPVLTPEERRERERERSRQWYWERGGREAKGHFRTRQEANRETAQARRIYPTAAEARAAARRRRKARLRRAETEPYSREEIAERDGWRCHLCRRPVSRKTWTIDHLVPVSRGGADTKANVRLAHHRCNSRRGARGVAQLLLFGE